MRLKLRPEGDPTNFVVLVDRRDVRMVPRRRRPRLPDKSLFAIGIADELGREYFQRDASFEHGVVGLIDDTHPATVELALDDVVRYRIARLELTGLAARRTIHAASI